MSHALTHPSSRSEFSDLNALIYSVLRKVFGCGVIAREALRRPEDRRQVGPDKFVKSGRVVLYCHIDYLPLRSSDGALAQ